MRADVQNRDFGKTNDDRLESIREAAPQVIDCWQAADDPKQPLVDSQLLVRYATLLSTNY
jgi:hypothetical protein